MCLGGDTHHLIKENQQIISEVVLWASPLCPTINLTFLNTVPLCLQWSLLLLLKSCPCGLSAPVRQVSVILFTIAAPGPETELATESMPNFLQWPDDWIKIVKFKFHFYPQVEITALSSEPPWGLRVSHQHQSPLACLIKCRFPGSAPDLLNQNLWNGAWQSTTKCNTKIWF